MSVEPFRRPSRTNQPHLPPGRCRENVCRIIAHRRIGWVEKLGGITGGSTRPGEPQPVWSACTLGGIGEVPLTGTRLSGISPRGKTERGHAHFRTAGELLTK